MGRDDMLGTPGGVAHAGLGKQELARVFERRRASGESLGRCLVALGWPDESAGLTALAEALQVRFVDLRETRVDPEAGKLLPPDLLQRARGMPVAITDGRLLLAMADPLDFGPEGPARRPHAVRRARGASDDGRGPALRRRARQGAPDGPGRAV